MNDKQPKNHGLIEAQQPQRPPPVKIPRRYQGKIFTSFSDSEKNIAHNGALECRALRSVTVLGRVIHRGEVFKTAANWVVAMALERDVEIIDARMDEEEKALAEAKRLGLHEPAPLDPRDFPEPNGKSWMRPEPASA